MKAILTAATLAATTLPALAFDPANMSDAEKQAFGEAVREYLMANPDVLVESINVLEERRMADEAKNDKLLVENNRKAIFDDGHSWVGGNPQGDITLVEFIDYRCGVCKRVNPEVEKLISADGNIRFILKEFPILTQESDMAARFAVAVHQQAGDDAYKRAHDALMSSRGPVNLETLGKLAGELGVDAKAVLNHMNTEEVSAVLRKNHQLAEQMRIMGTPTFIIEGEMLRGVPPDGLEGVIARVRAERQG
ncbi:MULTISPECIES: DsbA family protein [unclassified Paracoccus (in: a-proteobacteria)]|uniref:DsbA family protein n=1 Tax=unclassified Paracoccus (in: a-proteobacteria) TaxID=2688777 RepID=UPI0012B30654|nr:MULTISPECIES: DsbA family protein [unclassified Paracoccus (in: a-proteobacteria)]UXU74457.1 DsbA family protein [Paracoccus sp. SMMA_5]UXU80348.1 DsbA family protein [Paracoccus sp. SMMA_5_TC]